MAYRQNQWQQPSNATERQQKLLNQSYKVKITPLVIFALGHTRTHILTHTCPHKSDFRSRHVPTCGCWMSGQTVHISGTKTITLTMDSVWFATYNNRTIKSWIFFQNLYNGNCLIQDVWPP